MTVQKTATSHDQRPAGRSTDVGRYPPNEWDIFAAHTKSLDDRERAHLNTTLKAECVEIL